MAAEQSKSELTSTLHLNLRGVSPIPTNALEERLASLTQEDRDVIAQIRGKDSDKAMIFILRGANKGSRFLVTSEGVSIGRSAKSDVFLDDITVSRKHATIARVGSDFVLTDAGSLNGTYLANESVKEHTLISGDEFQIGKFHLFFIGSK